MAEVAALRELLETPMARNATVAYRKGIVLRRGDFVTRSLAWTSTLVNRAGRNWALHHPDGFEFLCALFGAWRAGKTVWLPGDACPATRGRLAQDVAGFFGDFPQDDVIRSAATEGRVRTPGAAAPPDPALVVYTSGSTGEPAAIPKTFAQLDAEILALDTQWGGRLQGSAVVATVPHHHMYGLLFKLLWPLARAVPFESESVSFPEEVVSVLAKRPTVWVASPALLKRLPEDLDWSVARNHLRLVLSAGGPLPLTTAQRAAALLGQGVVEVYGSSEAGAVAWRVQDQPSTRWRSLPGAKVLPAGRTGLLVVSSPWVSDTQPWASADRGEVYADGSFTLLGRADRIVKVEEKRVSLTQLEEALMATPWVVEARLLLLPQGRIGAAIVLSGEGTEIHARDGRRALIKRLSAELEQHAERVALPRRWRVVRELPQDALGKLRSDALLALFDSSGGGSLLPRLHSEIDDGNRRRLALFVAPGLPWFEGHFPDAPILPGVVQLHWAITLGRARFPLPSRFRGMEQIKFQRVITPGMEVNLELEYLPAKGVLAFRYDSASGVHASGRILFGH